MIVSTIKQFGLRLRADPEEIPFQHSANVQMKFEKDENFIDYAVLGYYIPPGESEAKLLNINDDGTFTLGPECFKNRGTLSLSFNLVNSIEEAHLGSIDFDVRHAFGDSSAILPEPEEVWISVVTKVAEDAIKEDVELVKQKAKEASQSALTANEKANEALEYANNAKDASNSATTAVGSAITAKDDAIAASNSASQFSDSAGKNAILASDSATMAKINANKTTEDRNEVERLVSGFDSHVVEKTTDFNQNATDKSGEFDNKVEQANTTIDGKVAEATKQAEKATEEANRATQATDGKLDKNQGAENANKVLGVGADGNVIPVKANSGNKLIGEVLLAEYTHQGNQEIHFSDFDWATATGTTTEPHGLTEATAVQVVPDGWVNNFGGNQSNVNKTMCSIPIEWMMYNGIIYLLPINENQVKVVKNDKNSPIIVNPDNTPSNDLINFSLFHFEMPIGIDINNLNSGINIKKLKVLICGVGSKPKGSRYLLFDNGYYILIPTTPAMSNANDVYHNFMYKIEAIVDNTQSIHPISNYLIRYIAQRKNYNIFVGDKKEESSFQLQNYLGNAYTFARFRINDNYAFLTNGTSVRIYVLEGEYNES